MNAVIPRFCSRMWWMTRVSDRAEKRPVERLGRPRKAERQGKLERPGGGQREGKLTFARTGGHLNRGGQ